VVDRIVDRIG